MIIKRLDLIQATYANSELEINSREIDNLKNCNLNCKNKIIITWNNEDEKEEIKFIPLWKWLLEE